MTNREVRERYSIVQGNEVTYIVKSNPCYASTDEIVYRADFRGTHYARLACTVQSDVGNSVADEGLHSALGSCIIRVLGSSSLVTIASRSGLFPIFFVFQNLSVTYQHPEAAVCISITSRHATHAF